MELDYVKLKDIKPAIMGYIRESQSLLKKEIVPDVKVVHDVRVLMKKSRAVIKLIATQSDLVKVNRDLTAFREVGRKLQLWRDTSVQRKTLNELRKEYPDIFSRLQENDIITTMLKKDEPKGEGTEELKTSLEEMEDILKRAGYRIRFQTMNMIDHQILIKELEKTYNKAVDTYLNCRNNPKSCNFHEFRKRAKDFLYQLYFFRPLNPSKVKTLEKKLDGITQNLGKYNDLAQLIKKLGYRYPDNTNLPPLDELIIKIREKQDGYLLKLWPSAYKIFCPGQKMVNVLGFKLLVI